MYSTFQKGKWGESLACEWLLANHFTIIQKNWFYRHAEIDLIARHLNTLVFVEVRLLHRRNLNLPENTISKNKRKKIASAAAAYTESIDYQGDIRFDIIGIIYTKYEKPEIRHFPDAFFPGLF
jgi:putative endonuclease